LHGKYVWKLLPGVLTLAVGVSIWTVAVSAEQTAEVQNSQSPEPPQSGASDVDHPITPKPGSPYADDAIKHYNHAVELHQSGFLNQAIGEYKAAIEADDRLEEAYSNLGLIYAAQRNYTKAIDVFNKALALRPARPTTLNGLGTVLYAKGKVKEAMEKWQQTVEADPSFAPAYYNIGNAFENEKDDQAAIDAYAKALKVNPSMSDAYYRIGSIYSRDKHLAQALLLLSRAVQLSPGAEFVHDAKKQISTLEIQLSTKDDEETQMPMKVIAPADNLNDAAKQQNK